MISVIIPIYNAERTLGPCVSSLLRQSYGDLEVLLVDDGSGDRSPEICREFARREERVRVLLQPNRGAAAARNAGLDAAHGEWVMFLDADDQLEVSAVAELVSCCTPDTDIAAGSCTVLLPDGKRVPCRFFPEAFHAATQEEKRPLYLQLMDTGYRQTRVYTGIGVPWSKLYRRMFLEDHALRFDTSLARMEDNLFNHYAFFHARRIEYRNICRYLYRYEHAGGLLRGYDPSYAAAAQAVVRARKACLERTGLIRDPVLRQAARNETLTLYATSLKRSVFHRSNPASYREEKEAAEELLNSEPFSVLLEPETAGMLQGTKRRTFYRLVRARNWLGIRLFLER